MNAFFRTIVLPLLALGLSSGPSAAQEMPGRSAVALLEALPSNVSGLERANLQLPFEPQARRVAEIVVLSGSPAAGLPVRGQTALIRLFDGEEQIATTVSVNERDGVSTWVGSIHHPQHDRSGFATLSRAADGSVYGTISFEERHYQVLTGRNRKQYLVEVDQSLFPQADFSGSEPEVAGKKMPAPEASQDPTKTTTVLNVMVVYSPYVVSHMGSVSTLIDNAMANLNQAAFDSGIDAVFHLAHSTQVSYDEVNKTPALVSADILAGNVSGVLALRDTYAADLVVMLVATDRINFNTCGTAETPDSFDSLAQKKNKAFAVVGDTCATGFFTFSHEIGHNLAARHQRSSNDIVDAQDNSGTTLYPSGHGFINTSGTYFRTIMANGSGCSTSTCPRINRWTNPSYTYAGVPIGLPSTDQNWADNAYAINGYKTTAVGYRTTPTNVSGMPASVTVDRLLCYGGNDVTWGAATGAVERYEMDTAPAGTSTWTNVYSGPAQWYYLDVTASTSVRVRACNQAGCGSYRSGNQTAQYYAGCL